jgi:hypothetical protein
MLGENLTGLQARRIADHSAMMSVLPKSAWCPWPTTAYSRNHLNLKSFLSVYCCRYQQKYQQDDERLADKIGSTDAAHRVALCRTKPTALADSVPRPQSLPVFAPDGRCIRGLGKSEGPGPERHPSGSGPGRSVLPNVRSVSLRPSSSQPVRNHDVIGAVVEVADYWLRRDALVCKVEAEEERVVETATEARGAKAVPASATVGLEPWPGYRRFAGSTSRFFEPEPAHFSRGRCTVSRRSSKVTPAAQRGSGRVPEAFLSFNP